MKWKDDFEKIWIETSNLQEVGYSSVYSEQGPSWNEKVLGILEKEKSKGLSTEKHLRFHAEFFGMGPLFEIINDENVTEILITDLDKICYEHRGQLKVLEDGFFSSITFRKFLDRICDATQSHLTAKNPFVDSYYKNFRLSLVGGEVSHGRIQVSLRRHPENPWTLEQLQDAGWADGHQLAFIQNLVRARKNFLIVGGTGSGKTSICNALLQYLPKEERVVVIEDTQEIKLPNSVSTKLLTRFDPHGELPDIDQGQLVRRALRLRPDRLVIGEVRGGEAKDLLMALATGHGGSFSTIHADSASQAMIRLEMLIQLGAPQWNIQAIRKLIQMSLEYLIVTKKNADGCRRLHSIFKISALEENGFLLDPVLNYSEISSNRFSIC